MASAVDSLAREHKLSEKSVDSGIRLEVRISIDTVRFVSSSYSIDFDSRKAWNFFEEFG